MLDGVQSDVLLLTDATNLRLQSIPAQTFAHPFEQRTLDVDVERLEKPALETSWTEHMLVSCLWNLIFRPGDKKNGNSQCNPSPSLYSLIFNDDFV